MIALSKAFCHYRNLSFEPPNSVFGETLPIFRTLSKLGCMINEK